MRLFIDMDGVLCDFVGGLCKLYNYTDAYPHNEYDLTKIFGPNVWKRITEAGEDFWMNLEKTPEADTIMELARKHDYYIATSPTLDPYSASGKMHWMEMNYPGIRRRFFITPFKALLARPRDVLIDDSDEQIAKWREAGGIGITVPRPWNQFYSETTDKTILSLQESLA